MIDRILEEDRSAPRKQRHTAKRIFERLRDEHDFEGGYTIVKDYVRERRLRSREVFVLWLPNILSDRTWRDSERCDMNSIHGRDHESSVVDPRIAAQVA